MRRATGTRYACVWLRWLALLIVVLPGLMLPAEAQDSDEPADAPANTADAPARDVNAADAESASAAEEDQPASGPDAPAPAPDVPVAAPDAPASEAGVSGTPFVGPL